ncbi:hypothetical protein J2797_001421 [Paraburkholderia terricola]|jgi:hypothetical protein|nr:hypothetical protein [Paraburkholderia terricola]
MQGKRTNPAQTWKPQRLSNAPGKKNQTTRDRYNRA